MSKDETYGKVVPVVSYDNEIDPQPAIGWASTMTEAMRKTRASGYRVMQSGGLIQFDGGYDNGDGAWLVTVHAPKG